jgi:hypothetical protein
MCVVFVGLNIEEVFLTALLEAVLAVELKLNLHRSAAKLGELAGFRGSTTTTLERRLLADPDKFLAGVIEVQINTLSSASS